MKTKIQYPAYAVKSDDGKKTRELSDVHCLEAISIVGQKQQDPNPVENFKNHRQDSPIAVGPNSKPGTIFTS